MQLTTDTYITKTVDELLPITKEDKKCMQKWLIKTKNRNQLERILKTFAEDAYCNYKFDKRQ